MGAPPAHALPSARILRPELIDLLDHSRDFALTLILAPAGSGKSTLLGQWSAGQDRRLARLALNRRDADPVRFLQRLNQALRLAMPDFVMLSCNALSTDLDQADQLARTLGDSLAAVREDFFLLIDDFHYASAPLIQRIFARLLEELPPHVHVILSSRSHPGFSLSRLKLEDRLLLIDRHDLRLPADEVQALCRSLRLPPLEVREAEMLLGLTEGWVAGIKLALLARRRNGRFMPEDFNGSQPELVDYFADVVLADLPAPERDFLLATALFERFDLTLCAGLPGLTDTAARLEHVLQSGLFLQTVDDAPGWFRYHPLFRNFLKARLQQENPQRREELHLAAARHFMNSGDEETALFHARRSGRPEDFLDLLRNACERWLRQGKLITILQHLEDVAPDRLRNDPGLFIPQLAALIFSRQFVKARYCLDEFRVCNSYDSCPERISDTLAYMDKVLTLFQNDAELWNDPALFHDDGIPHHDLRDMSVALTARYHLLNGECEAAVRLAGQARILLDNLGHEYLTSFADVIQILAERELGHIFAARQMTQAFYQRHSDRPKSPSWVNAGTCMAVSLYEQNRVAEARELCEALIQHVDSACATEIVFNVYVTLARLQYIGGHNPRGAQLLLQLRRILRHGRYRRLLNQLLAEELSQAIRSGHTAAIKGIAAEYELPAAISQGLWSRPRPDYREDWVYGGIAAALLLRTRKQYDRALDILQHLADSLRHTEMKTRLVVVEANRIVIIALQQNGAAALQVLAELFARVGLQCAIRTVFDEAPGFGGLVRQAHEQGVIALPDIYLQLYADILYPPVSAPGPAAGPEPLTTKELEVLGLVRQGLANKEISRELDISLSTTKWHLKNIFAKLQVGNRTSAMAALSRAESGQRLAG